MAGKFDTLSPDRVHPTLTSAVSFRLKVKVWSLTVMTIPSFVFGTTVESIPHWMDACESGYAMTRKSEAVLERAAASRLWEFTRMDASPRKLVSALPLESVDGNASARSMLPVQKARVPAGTPIRFRVIRSWSVLKTAPYFLLARVSKICLRGTPPLA